MKNLFTFILIVMYSFGFGQSSTIDNSLNGYFKRIEGDGFYEEFSFDGNGKAMIGMFTMEYPFFQTNDTLVVYPDKSYFVFKLKQDTLIGVSDWVKEQKWLRVKDSVISSNVEDKAFSKKQSLLLYEFHKLMSNENISDEELLQQMEGLCDKGSGKACSLLLNQSIFDAIGLLPLKKKQYPIDSKILLYADKADKAGEVEAYKIYAEYLLAIYREKEAVEFLYKAKERGSLTAGLKLLELED